MLCVIMMPGDRVEVSSGLQCSLVSPQISRFPRGLDTWVEMSLGD